MNALGKTFETERVGDVLVVKAMGELGELHFQEIEAEAGEVLAQVKESDIMGVVVDLGFADYFGSSALGFFARLWQRMRARNGHMALCNVSPHGHELFHLTGLDSLWQCYPSLEEALQAVQ